MRMEGDEKKNFSRREHRGTEQGKAKSKCRRIHIDMRDGRDGRRIGPDFRLRGNDE